LNCVSRKVAALLQSGRIRLVVIDSIAGLFRGDLESEQPVAGRTTLTGDFFVKRAKRLGSLAGQLHRLSFQYNAAVVVVNQV
jgi:RecA/RadA recombinase